jgi:prepilin-type N-terminal cleavage/methylation domain
MNARTVSARAGFSLIEVLVSVVVMSFGLLSLAALQSTLFKSGAESRAQSVALSMASEKLEYFDGYRDRTEFQGFTDGNDSAVTVDGISYTRSWTIDRYAYPKPTGTVPNPSFALLATDTGETPSGYVSNNEFKRIQVKVGWTDATGASQEVALESAIAALSPQDTAKVAKVSSTGGPRGPEIIITNPANEEGVIPIAVGDGTDTAATNPKPEVAGKSNSQRVIETRFDVLTYAALSGGTNALAQSRVETVVAGCSCDYGNAPASTTRGKRPTYWNGLRYVVPEDADYAPPAGLDTSEQVQSTQCTICCRDHHDPSGIAGARFDPRRGSHAEHQLYNASSGTLGDLSSSGKYTEACRLIRVDGIFRVASDAYDDFMNLLETDNNPSTLISDYVPTEAATTNYQNFVLDYLDTKFVAGNQSGYNTALDPSGPVVTGLVTKHSLDNPTAPLPIDRADSGSTLKWLHDRGLYVDYLEDEAIQAVNDAKDDCPGTGTAPPTSAQLRTCVLKVLPFTTINVTELADWTTADATQIVVSNNDFRTSLASDTPVRGKVVPGVKPTSVRVTNAIAVMRRSNSGLAVLKGPIDFGDEATWTDVQPFKPDPKWDGETGIGKGGIYSISLDSYAFTNVYPTFQVSPSATCNPATSGNVRPNPFTCTTQRTGEPQSILVANYNYQINSQSKKENLTCKKTGGSDIVRKLTYTTKTCRNYSVSGATLTKAADGTTTTVTTLPVIANEGKTSETSTISFPTVAPNDVLSITFGAPVDTVQTPVCTYVDDGNNANEVTVDVPDCP